MKLLLTDSVASETEADQHLQASDDRTVTYQASSPDEVALVQWTQEVGLTLNRRDLTSMQLLAPDGRVINYSILQVFPFTSETKRMGIIVKVIVIGLLGEWISFNGSFAGSPYGGDIFLFERCRRRDGCHRAVH